MAPRLKVFVTSDGLTDYVVATTSRAKALAAWGVRQDLFREGAAREVTDPIIARAATAQPGVVLRQPTGAKAPRLKPQPKRRGPSERRLRELAALEAKLTALEAELQASLADIARRRAELDREELSLRRRATLRRDKLSDQIRAARAAPE